MSEKSTATTATKTTITPHVYLDVQLGKGHPLTMILETVRKIQDTGRFHFSEKGITIDVRDSHNQQIMMNALIKQEACKKYFISEPQWFQISPALFYSFIKSNKNNKTNSELHLYRSTEFGAQNIRLLQPADQDRTEETDWLQPTNTKQWDPEPELYMQAVQRQCLSKYWASAIKKLSDASNQYASIELTKYGYIVKGKSGNTIRLRSIKYSDIRQYPEDSYLPEESGKHHGIFEVNTLKSCLKACALADQVTVVLDQIQEKDILIFAWSLANRLSPQQPWGSVKYVLLNINQALEQCCPEAAQILGYRKDKVVET